MVTGGCGFIGSNFIRYLLDQPDSPERIVNVDKLTYAGNPENLIDIPPGYPGRYVFEWADICDFEGMADIFRKYEVDGICHFAAESHVDRSIKRPGAFIHTNIVGTYNLLEIARGAPDRFVLFHHISTDEVYGSLGKRGYFRETTPYRPSSPYSASKASSDHLVRAYFRTFGLPVTISNCSNNYGPYQFPEKLIPLMILYALEGRSLPVYGDGKNVRDWLYVEDHAKALALVLEKGVPGRSYNVGGNNERTNLQVVETICEILDQFAPLCRRAEVRGHNSGKEKLIAELRHPISGQKLSSYKELITFVADRPGHDKRYAIDATRIRRELGWSAAESFETGIAKTVQWYLDNAWWWQPIREKQYSGQRLGKLTK